MIRRYLAFLDLKDYQLSFLAKDLLASPSVTFLDIPQGVAYAMIAGLPPAMGLYAAAVPAIVGALFRSSHHVVTGPTNALSFLVGGAVAAEVARSGATPMEVAVTLAFMVGVLQALAGVLRLDAMADYISHAVVRGYITGAAVLIGIGQLSNVTGTSRVQGEVLEVFTAWLTHLPETSPLSVLFATGTIAFVVWMRRVNRRIPASIIAMALGILLARVFSLSQAGLETIADLAPMPSGLPPLTIPNVENWSMLIPAAVACAVLSLVESSSVARALSSQTGQRLDMAAEFTGQGLANIAAAFSGGYPVSGSLARSALNTQAGAQSRLAAMFCGITMLGVLLFLGPLVNDTPIASLAGLLLVLAADLIDWKQIRMILRGTLRDRLAFVATLLGTWTLPLDQAIYVGVGISILLFLQRARLLTIREMAIGEKGRFREVEPDQEEPIRRCTSVRVLNVTGSVFFAAAGELQTLMDHIAADPHVRVLILRMRQAEDLDVTTASVLEAASHQLARRGKTLLLLGLRSSALELLERTGVRDYVGQENVFPAQSSWFTAMEEALQRALDIVGEHACGQACPFAEYLAEQAMLRTAVGSVGWVEGRNPPGVG